MKKQALKIKFESAADFEKRTLNALRKREKSRRPKDTIFFSTVTAYQKFMTEQKYAILAAIYHHRPSSLYQLAKLVNRDLANVKRDCDSLVAGVFIILEDADDKRGAKLPKLAFDYHIIIIYMPNTTYSHHLSEAA